MPLVVKDVMSAYTMTAVCNSEQVSGLHNTVVLIVGVCTDKGKDITSCSVVHSQISLCPLQREHADVILAW